MRILLAITTTLFLTMIASWSPAAVPAKQQCSLGSEGIYNGLWVKHRITVGENVIYGADNMEAITAELGTLRTQGLCH